MHDGLTEKSAEQVQMLMQTGQVTQEEITAALFDFYKTRYTNMADNDILDVLRQGL